MLDENRSSRRIRLSPVRVQAAVWLASTIAVTAWIGLIFLAPYLRSHSSRWQGLIYAVFAPVCHQIPGRSFSIFGQPLAVCARCLGIYIGILVGVAFYPLFRGFRRLELPTAKVFLLISSPIVIDTIGNFLKLWETPKQLRLGIGLIWGTILPFYFIAGVVELILGRKRKDLGIQAD